MARPSIKTTVLPVVMYNQVVNCAVRVELEMQNPNLVGYMPPMISPDFFRVVGRYMFLYRSSDGKEFRRVVEARVLFNYWHDFCGGIQFYSPQVMIHEDGEGWNGRTGWCIADYASRDLTRHSKDWGLGATILPDLNAIFARESITNEEAEDLAWRAIAGGVMTASLTSRRRFMTGVDRVNRDSNLERFVRTMQDISERELLIPDNCYTYYGSIDDRLKDCSNMGVHLPYGTRVVTMSVESVQGVNWNSSRECAVFTCILNPDDEYGGENSYEECDYTCGSCGYEFTDYVDAGYVECPECGSGDAAPCNQARRRKLPPLFKSTAHADECAKMATSRFAKYLPRQLWRNG